MAGKVLVGYATQYGSTKEVAEAIAETLRENGFEVDLQPLNKVRTLESYSAVVMGAPLIMFHWHRDALNFLSRHRNALIGTAGGDLCARTDTRTPRCSRVEGFAGTA